MYVWCVRLHDCVCPCAWVFVHARVCVCVCVCTCTCVSMIVSTHELEIRNFVENYIFTYDYLF